jgi:hypothetical protein
LGKMLKPKLGGARWRAGSSYPQTYPLKLGQVRAPTSDAARIHLSILLRQHQPLTNYAALCNVRQRPGHLLECEPA